MSSSESIFSNRLSESSPPQHGLTWPTQICLCGEVNSLWLPFVICVSGWGRTVKTHLSLWSCLPYQGKQCVDRHYRASMLFEAKAKESLCLVLGLLEWWFEEEASFIFKGAAVFLIILKFMRIMGIIRVVECPIFACDSVGVCPLLQQNYK